MNSLFVRILTQGVGGWVSPNLLRVKPFPSLKIPTQANTQPIFYSLTPSRYWRGRLRRTPQMLKGKRKELNIKRTKI